jgi:vacuolar-type H+-ATPase subunit E/Vma4
MTHKIFEKTLPQILDEEEANLKRLEDLIQRTEKAGQEAREAAKEASKAGEKAAREVFEKADKKIDNVVNALVELMKADCKSRREFNDNFLEDVNKILGSLTT